MSSLRPVDLDHLSRYTGGDTRVNAEILTLFANQSAELLIRLDTALHQSDSKTWRAVNHSLKGGARGIGAFHLAEKAAEAEGTDPASDQRRAARTLHDLKSRTLAVTLFIESYLGSS
jgi:HPt (histidine-containing phosphotransfer) domain-containing protein